MPPHCKAQQSIITAADGDHAQFMRLLATKQSSHANTSRRDLSQKVFITLGNLIHAHRSDIEQRDDELKRILAELFDLTVTGLVVVCGWTTVSAGTLTGLEIYWLSPTGPEALDLYQCCMSALNSANKGWYPNILTAVLSMCSHLGFPQSELFKMSEAACKD